ncbi:related to cytochrome P450 7B1 [Phialocephala subalpina]|uniref:Related to cytochrome P450 7B1 n=1 Tax=Phialocephala subalpina TaxID=576137 RepID=A0A1L7XBZ1_9HELO|nr:related to cytochrome P450 7B1 [Phialocephala subalpina]
MPVADAVSILSQGYTPSIILAVVAVLLIIRQRLAVQLDPKEPPILKPKVPYIGHIIGLFQHHGAYFDKLYARKPMPIATLPMINAKLYIITDPVMAQNAFRHKNLSFDPFTLEFAQRMLGVSDESMVPVRFAGDEKNPGFLAQFLKEIHEAMRGEYLHKMNADVLNGVAVTINELGKTFEPESLFYWLRGTITVATSNALFGSFNPFKDDPALGDALWDFDNGLMGLILNLFPAITFPAAYKGRAKIQEALIKYYTAEHDLDPSVSQMAKVRAALFRRKGIPAFDIGKFELALIHVSTANAIPTLFWNLCFVATAPKTTATIRKEIESIITVSTLDNGKREAVIDITKFDTHCPVLVSSYRETIRLANAQLGARRAMEDTILSDGKNEYLLKAGCDIQLPAGVPHLNEAAWGPTASSFDATRFMSPEERGDSSAKARLEDREQKRSYFPFGGGKHLCPGRNFAFAEILGTIAVLVTGFDVNNRDGGMIEIPKLGRARLGEGVAKPTGKGLTMGARIERRTGWEDVVWKFTC